MTEGAVSKWDQIYSRSTTGMPEPNANLKDFAHLLPVRGTVLDVACGMGGNALFLAERGLNTLAFDISSVAIKKLQEFAVQRNLNIQCEIQDIQAFVWEEERFDVMVVSRFLERTMVSAMMTSLKPGGVLFFQGFTQEKVSDTGPNNPNYLLAENELLSLFKPLRLLVYREEGRVGDITVGLRNEVFLIGQRRS